MYLSLLFDNQKNYVVHNNLNQSQQRKGKTEILGKMSKFFGEHLTTVNHTNNNNEKRRT